MALQLTGAYKRDVAREPAGAAAGDRHRRRPDRDRHRDRAARLLRRCRSRRRSSAIDDARRRAAARRRARDVRRRGARASSTSSSSTAARSATSARAPRDEGREPRLPAAARRVGRRHARLPQARCIDSPAYRLNHEEVDKSLEEGVRYVENLAPIEAVLDERGARQGDDASSGRRSTDGKWSAPARSSSCRRARVCVAAGTSPNTIYEKEYPGTFELDERRQFFQAAQGARRRRTASSSLEPADAEDGFFTSLQRRTARVVSFYGDNHPHYAGSVVKAMAQREGRLPARRRALRRRARALDADGAAGARRATLGALFAEARRRARRATCVEVNRLTPTIVEVVVRAPLAARKFQPGQFYRLQNYETHAPRRRRHAPRRWRASRSPARGSTRRRACSRMIVLEMGGSLAPVRRAASRASRSW